jgi:predicted DNA-binding transcriptional regulator YafY
MARAKRGINLRSFAAQRGWSGRALYRDIESLCAAGVPVEHPEHGWYRVADGWIPAGTVDVQRDELLALFVARQLAPGLKDTPVGRPLDNLWAKLSTPGRQPSLTLGDDAWFQVIAPAAIDYGPYRMVLDAAREAVRSHRALEIHHRKSSGEESRRTIEPLQVCWHLQEQAMYVHAWCRLRDESRMFAVHRVVGARLTGELFVPRRDAVLEMSKAFRMWPRPGVERVVLRFSPRVAGEIRERRWHASERRRDALDGGVILELDVGAPEELERWLLGYGPDVAVDAPLRLASRLRELHAAAAALPAIVAVPSRAAKSATDATVSPASTAAMPPTIAATASATSSRAAIIVPEIGAPTAGATSWPATSVAVVSPEGTTAMAEALEVAVSSTTTSSTTPELGAAAAPERTGLLRKGQMQAVCAARKRRASGGV